MRIKDKIDKHLNNTFSSNLLEYLSNAFPGVAFETKINLSTMGMVTVWDTEDPEICAEIKKHVGAYESAYTKAREEIGRLR